MDHQKAKKQLKAMEEKLKETECKLVEFSAVEDDRVQQLRQISQEGDKVWQSELEVLQEEHSNDSAALGSSMNEIQRLKQQLDKSKTSHVEDFEKRVKPLFEVKSVASQSELKQLGAALEATEAKLQEEQIQTTMKMPDRVEMVIERLNADGRDLVSESGIENVFVITKKVDLHTVRGDLKHHFLLAQAR
ncbi:Interactor of constitutive active ROPs 5 [Dendrobium catenatum]|uniref:Interactor of constitutive active ROPs 5 n=1 Tax=Dendrobium catenatum TaxID=906689 RepID=A0A2I0WLL0_9ASPA|nr:Interactor of constitutive active ROPs 5 [Dendrobium catenatum]